MDAQIWPDLSLALTLEKTGPAPHLLQNPGEQVLYFALQYSRADPAETVAGELALSMRAEEIKTCPSFSIWWHGQGKVVLPHCSLPPVAGARAGPEILRAGELVLPLPGCSTQESLPGQHSAAALIGPGMG